MENNQNVDQSSPLSQSSAPSLFNSAGTNNKLPIIIGLGLIFFLIAGSIFFILNRPPKNPAAQNNPTETPTQTNTPLGSSLPKAEPTHAVKTAAWKTYDSPYMSFKYPPEWNPTKSQAGGISKEAVNLHIPGILGSQTGDDTIGFYTAEYSIQGDGPIYMRQIEINKSEGNKYFRTTTVNGKNIYSYDYFTKSPDGQGSFVVHVNVDKQDDALEEQLDEMVSSVVFK